MRPMRPRSSCAIGRRPACPPRLERLRQYARQPCRCQRSTVSGFTMSKDVRHAGNHRHARIQKPRSALFGRGRGFRRCSTRSCCRRQMLSAISRSFGLNTAAIPHNKHRHNGPSRLLSGYQEGEVDPCRQCKCKGFRVMILRPSGAKCRFSLALLAVRRTSQ